MTERNTLKLLDRAREMCSPPTDYQLAKRLALPRATVSNWRRGINAPDTQAAWKIAQILGLPTTDVIAYVEADRAKDPAKRAWWESQLPRILSAFAIAIALGASTIGGPLNAEAQAHALQPIYYAQFALMLGLLTLLTSLSDPRGHGRPPNAA